MNSEKVMATSTAMVAFSTFLGVLFALLYYLYLILNVNIYEAVLYATIYIDLNLTFLYILRGG